jgi:hypothetical protein
VDAAVGSSGTSLGLFSAAFTGPTNGLVSYNWAGALGGLIYPYTNWTTQTSRYWTVTSSNATCLKTGLYETHWSICGLPYTSDSAATQDSQIMAALRTNNIAMPELSCWRDDYVVDDIGASKNTRPSTAQFHSGGIVPISSGTVVTVTLMGNTNSQLYIDYNTLKWRGYGSSWTMRQIE